MNSQLDRISNLSKSILIAAALLGAPTLRVTAAQGNPGIMPPQSHPNGKTYGEWSAAWWTWAMQLPPDSNHPFNNTDLNFNLGVGNSGQVWFVGAPFGTNVHNCTMPTGVSLFVGLLNAEASDLEGLGTTEAQQRDTAKSLADHIINLRCTIDNAVIQNLPSYRFVSAQFTFNAPTPWIFGPTGGLGHSVSDGYFLMLAPLSVGTHTIHFGGEFHFTLADDGFDADYPLDMTYNLTVQ
jgi:hypothetical protein